MDKPLIDGLPADIALGEYLPAEGQQFLGSPDVMEEVLRDYLSSIAYAKADMDRGALTPEGFQAKVHDLARKVQTIVYGKDTAYRGTPWNTAGQLGAYIVGPLGGGGDASDAVYRLMGRLFSQLATVLAAFEAGTQTDEWFQFNSDALVEEYRHHLLGEPFDADE